MNTDRKDFLKAFAGLFVATAVMPPLPTLTATSVAPAAPVTLEECFYSELGAIKNVVFVSRPGLDRMVTVSQAFTFCVNGNQYYHAIDTESLLEFKSLEIMVEKLRQDAKTLGALAKQQIAMLGSPVLDDQSDLVKLVKDAWWRQPELWPDAFREVIG